MNIEKYIAKVFDRLLSNQKSQYFNFMIALVILDVALVIYGLFTSQGVNEYKLTWIIGAQALILLLSFAALTSKKQVISQTKIPIRSYLLVAYMFGVVALFLAWVSAAEYKLVTSAVRNNGVTVNGKVIDYQLTTSNDFRILHVGRRFETNNVNQASNLYVTVQYNGRTERYVVYKDVIHSSGAGKFAEVVNQVKSGTLPIRYLPQAPYILRAQSEVMT